MMGTEQSMGKDLTLWGIGGPGREFDFNPSVTKGHRRVPKQTKEVVWYLLHKEQPGVWRVDWGTGSQWGGTRGCREWGRRLLMSSR